MSGPQFDDGFAGGSTGQRRASTANEAPRSAAPPCRDRPASAPVSEDEYDRPALRYTKSMLPSSDLPDSSLWEHEKSSSTPGNDTQGEQFWDASRAVVAADQVDLLEAIVPRDRRESALKMLHRNGYQINGILDKVMQKEPAHGLNWSPATKRKFANILVDSRRKNFPQLAKQLKKKAGDCQAYYYSHFKGTSEYRVMKRAGKRQMTTRSSQGVDSATVEANTYVRADAKASLEEAARSGCRKCKKELASGAKLQRESHDESCPRKRFKRRRVAVDEETRGSSEGEEARGGSTGAPSPKEAKTSLRVDAKPSLEEAARSGCTKCKLELATGEKTRREHGDSCPRKRRISEGSAPSDAEAKAETVAGNAPTMANGKPSLEEAVKSGCTKCKLELATGEKTRREHGDGCPRKRRSSAVEEEDSGDGSDEKCEVEKSTGSRLFKDECSMCDEEAGELAKCDICRRVFHLHCVGLDAVPTEIWFCTECDLY